MKNGLEVSGAATSEESLEDYFKRVTAPIIAEKGCFFNAVHTVGGTTAWSFPVQLGEVF